MILIDTATLKLHDFPNSDHRYAILSHTWGPAGEEVSYDEMMASERSVTTLVKPGYDKIVRTCEIARANYNLPYAWVDTCCINKASSAELSEAINSMFRWYKEAWVCFAYLCDMDGGTLSFQQSRWFTRGWTLQELIAPKDLIFFDRHWDFAGTKEMQASAISEITGIPMFVMAQNADLNDIPVAQRFSWASTRQTTREEDRAYSLLGLFDINMPMLYGEGSKAFLRLQEHIVSQNADLSIFMWTDLDTRQAFTGIFAPSPSCFLQMRNASGHDTLVPHEFYSTNRGMRLKLRIAWGDITGLAILPLKHSIRTGRASDWASALENRPVGIYLRKVGVDLFVRAQPAVCPAVNNEQSDLSTITVMKTLSEQQSERITSSVINVSIPIGLTAQAEPYGSWDSQTQLLYAGHAGSFAGYMQFWKNNTVLFAIVFSFRGGCWSAETREGTEISSLAQTYQRHSGAEFEGLRFSASRRNALMAEIPHIYGTAVTVNMRGGNAAPIPCIEIRVIDKKSSETSLAMR